MLRTLAKQIGQYKRETILAPVTMVGEVLMDTMIPFIISRLIDQGITAQNIGAVWKYGGLMLLFAFASLYFGVASGRYSAIAGTGFSTNLRDTMYRKIQTFSFSNIDRFSTAGLVTRITTDVTNIQNAFQMLIRIAVRAPAIMITSIIMCVIISPSLSTVFLVAMVVLICAAVFIVSNAMAAFNQAFQRYDDLNASVEENVAGARVVKAYVREGFEQEKFHQATGNLRRVFVRAERLVALNGPVMTLVINGCVIGLSWFGARLIVGGSLTTGQLTSMFSYVMQILMSLQMLSMIFVMLTMSAASARRVAQVLDEEPDITNPASPVMDVQSGEIEYDHVTFRYQAGGDDAVLKDVDLRIHSGETIGVIGGTGSGKSSLVNLLSRLYDVQEGSVRVGGVDVREYDLEVLRDSVAVVLQKNVLFSGTVLSNLRWGKADATEEECREACRLACADEFIEKMPDGYESRVEQGGSNFSGGQKQRLCIARALLKKPKVLILDDSTSAVDTATDARIRKAFREVIPDTTKIIIAQRVASIQDADRIIVIDDGVISGFGTHGELMESNELYREIYETQTQGGGDFDEPAVD